MSKITEAGAFAFFPENTDYTSLKNATANCRGCDLYKPATQTVFGEGQFRPQVVFIGEQPGDEEDIKGHPFVGPAGGLFDKALIEAGIDCTKTYVTNTVKHFKFTERGKRRIHEKPRVREINACLPWLGAEIEMLQPPIVVCLGATAAQGLLGPDFRVTKMRGQWLVTNFSENVIATVHPSSILRSFDDREAEYRAFVADLAIVAARIAELQ